MAALKTKNANEKKHRLNGTGLSRSFFVPVGNSGSRDKRHRIEKVVNPRSSFLAIGALAAVLLVPAAAPANAAPASNDTLLRVSEVATSLNFSTAPTMSVITADPKVKLTFSTPTVTSQPAPKPEPKVEAVTAQSSEVAPQAAAINAQPEDVYSPQAAPQQAAPQQAPVVPQAAPVAPAAAAPVVNVPSGSKGAGIVASALSQLGTKQDCTDLVQNSLAAVGLTTRRDQGGPDMGTGTEQYNRFGTQVSTSALAPGDILFYGYSHVAIYIGNGQAVHGGWNGFDTAVFSVNLPGQPLTGAIRVS